MMTSSPVYNSFSLHRNSAFHRWPPPYSASLLSPAPSFPSTFISCYFHGADTSFYRLHHRRRKCSSPEKAPGCRREPRDSELVEKEGEGGGGFGFLAALEDVPEANSAIISACLVGLLTGFSVVLFNYGVHELRDYSWDGVLDRGASWLREEPIEKTWRRTISVPLCGGVVVSMLNVLRSSFDVPTQGEFIRRAKDVLQPLLKTLAACITLGTGNSLGPEGPSVEIGSSIAKGVGSLLGNTRMKIPLVAAGSAAGLASGFNAAVAGCFFAVESVLWPSPDSAVSLTYTTSMVILSAVIAAVVSEVGLGSQPAFKVPEYDFRSVSELPLYLLLGILCGLVSLALTRCTMLMLRAVEKVQTGGIPQAVFPATGGLVVGLTALAYPEILYWGFQNVDVLLESRPFVKGLPADLLIQIVAVKIFLTSYCRASGLVGGYYAPSLFIGAGTGMAYGKLIAIAVSQSHPIFQSFLFEVASPQAYALVGMAATLAGVCQVPLTAVLLLFELTQDYRIVIPLLAAVGMSSWITSPRLKGSDSEDISKTNQNNPDDLQDGASSRNSESVDYSFLTKASRGDDVCELESSRCFDDSDIENEELQRKILVSQAMRTRFATVLKSTLVIEAVSLMLAEKQSYAFIVNDDNVLIGILSLEHIQVFCKSTQAKRRLPEGLLVEEVFSFVGEKCKVIWTTTPSMDLLSAEMIMVRHRLDQLPVVSERHLGTPVGVIDMECITLACRAVATKEYLNQKFITAKPSP